MAKKLIVNKKFEYTYDLVGKNRISICYKLNTSLLPVM